MHFVKLAPFVVTFLALATPALSHHPRSLERHIATRATGVATLETVLGEINAVVTNTCVVNCAEFVAGAGVCVAEIATRLSSTCECAPTLVTHLEACGNCIIKAAGSAPGTGTAKTIFNSLTGDFSAVCGVVLALLPVP